MEFVNWGIISTAKIARQKVIPAIQQATHCRVKGIASRSRKRAQQVSEKLEIPVSYGSYEELLDDPDIQAIYNPLPNHLHVPWTKKALQAGKHVLCEKPIALDAEEAQALITATTEKPDLKIMEAFMYRFHPQWQYTKKLVEQGEIGDLQTIESFFSYYNDDPGNIRNQKEMGGGGLMDIGCYCISLSRYLFDAEPLQVSGYWKINPEFEADFLASGILNFSSGQSTFTCSTMTAPCQRVNVVGTRGRIEIAVPFNAPPNETTRIDIYNPNGRENKIFPPVDQYTLQAEAFTKAILEDTPVPTPLEDALQNMKVIDAFRRSARELKAVNLS